MSGEQSAAPGPRCEWRQTEDGQWETCCGRSFEFMDGDPTSNEQYFCCFCGLKLAPVAYEEVEPCPPDLSAQLQQALDEAAEVIRATYPHIPGPMFVLTQDWFGRYQGLLTPAPSKVLNEIAATIEEARIMATDAGTEQIMQEWAVGRLAPKPSRR